VGGGEDMAPAAAWGRQATRPAPAGHSSIRVTMDTYTFVRLDSQQSAFDRVGDALRGDGTWSDDMAAQLVFS
jgi:hypothetical protein